MPDVSPQSPYRDLGDCSWTTFAGTLHGTPLYPIGTSIVPVLALYDTLRGYTRLYLGVSWVENRHHITWKLLPPSTHNNLALKPRGYWEESGTITESNLTFATFPSYTDCAKAFLRRFTDPALKYKDATSLWEFCLVYHPFGDKHPTTGNVNNTTEYCNRVVAYINTTVPRVSDPREEPVVATPTIENITDLRVQRKYGLTPVGVQDILSSTTRWATGRPEGICLHVQQGNTGGSLRDHATDRQASANVYLNLDGTIVQAVPTTSGAWTQGIDPAESHPSDRGKDFLDQFGVWNANSVVLSIEAEGFDNGVHPKVQLDSILWQIREWQKTFPWIGDNEVLRHADFDQVNRSYCPGWYYDEILKMMAQDGKPPKSPVTYPEYLDEGVCKALFGSARDAEGRTYAYTEGGVLSTYWLSNPSKFNYSQIDDVHSYEGGARRYVQFASGPLLFIGSDGKIIEVG